MTIGNVIDLNLYRAERDAKQTAPISTELETAIQDLIYQLREQGPFIPPKSGTNR